MWTCKDKWRKLHSTPSQTNIRHEGMHRQYDTAYNGSWKPQPTRSTMRHEIGEKIRRHFEEPTAYHRC